jgi:DegV family protein with EDD domain
MPRVTVVTDSTAYLPTELAEGHGIEVVSLKYRFAGQDSLDEVVAGDLHAFYAQLQDSESLPVTSPPRVEDFMATYEPLLADGGGVVSVHISSGISETCTAARRAAQELSNGAGGDRVRVVDSAWLGASGLLALAGARAAAAGRSLDEVEDLLREARAAGRVWFVLDTLEFLKRGGRIGSAAAWIGSTLQVKPILTVESEIKAVERVRTRERSIERLVEYAQELRSSGSDGWLAMHSRAESEATQLAGRLQEVFWRPPEYIAEVGPVIGTHVGPGLLGIAAIPSRFLE